MNRREFILRLEQALQGMPAEERRRAVEYYENYFDEAGPENEQEVLRNLGAPEKVAADILGEYREVAQPSPEGKKQQGSQKTENLRDWFQSRDNGQKLLLLVLLIAAAVSITPVCVGVVGGVGGILIAGVCLILTIFLLVPALDLAAWCGTIAFAIAAGAVAADNPPLALLFIGLALICVALGILLWRLTIYLFCNVFAALLRGIVDFFRRLLHRSS